LRAFAIFAVKYSNARGGKGFAKIREEALFSYLRKQLKPYLARPKVTDGYGEIVGRIPGPLKISPLIPNISRLQKILLAGILMT
jgi:hypothetical protein